MFQIIKKIFVQEKNIGVMVYEKNIPMNLYLGRHLINLNVPNKIAQKLIGVHVNVAKAFQALLLSYHYRNKFYCTVEFNR